MTHRVSALDAPRIEALRADTPGCGDHVHLNSAGASLMPTPVLEALFEHLQLEARLGGYEAADDRAEAIAGAYAAVADLIGAPPGNVAMVENATVACALVLSAVPFQAGDRLLTTVNDYVSNQIMYLSLARRLGIEVVRAPDRPEGGVDPDAMADLIRAHRPRLVSVTEIPTSSGLVQPVAEIGAVCRAHEVPYLVDGCQAIGQRVVDVEAMGCDFYAASARKFLRGPRGAGFLYVSPRALAAGLEPMFPDLRGATWTAPDRYRPAADARRFENWEFAVALVLGTGAAARYARAVGLDAIQDRVTALSDRLRDALSGFGLQVLDRGTVRAGIVTVEVPGWEAEAVQSALRQRGIHASTTSLDSARIDFEDKGVDWALRLSPHYFNRDDEIERAAAEVSALARRGPG